MFDLDVQSRSIERFSCEIPDNSLQWRIGAIVGPSGSGKTTVARKAFGDRVISDQSWPADRAIVDGFGDLSIKAITHALTAVGFSSPPAWVRPYHVLSNGQKFRCDLARAMLQADELLVYDEFTSVVDRTVAQIGSAAIAKAVRERDITRRFVAVSCHYDILEWLQADWTLDMATCSLDWGRLQRPPIKLEIFRCDRKAWGMFARHHYLDESLHKAAQCYLCTWEGAAVGFLAMMPMVGQRKYRRISRVVVLPDYQGIGIGSALVDMVAESYQRDGMRVGITTSNPSMINALRRSNRWRTKDVAISGHTRCTIWGCATYTWSAGRSVVSFEFGKAAVNG